MMMTSATAYINNSSLKLSPPLAAPSRSVDDGLFLTQNPVMARIHEQLQRVSTFDITVLLLGESGVGKEVFARRIHRLSSRAHRTFLKINCAALPADLLESELFGYEVGAFTGAVKSKPGLFELCNRGTILFDEIGELPPPLQAKLLQVLQDRQFCRLGGRSLISVDVRILAATKVDVRQALASKKLREDLYYRLSGFMLQIPPLRQRPEEIPHLLRYFMELQARRIGVTPKRISPRVYEACLKHSWPGNVRELENFVKSMLVLDDEEAGLAELSAAGPLAGESSADPSDSSKLERPTDLKRLVR
jgi:transcriptional regulator with PAS, ATPase and Fis domain